MGTEICSWRDALECLLKQQVAGSEASQTRVRMISEELSISSTWKTTAMIEELFQKSKNYPQAALSYRTDQRLSGRTILFFKWMCILSGEWGHKAQDSNWIVTWGNFWQACHLSIFSPDPVVLGGIRGEKRINVIVRRQIHSFFETEIPLVEVD